MSTNKLLLIIAGECFRDGGQNSRTKDTPRSVQSQLLACDNHIKFIEYLKNKYNIEVDIQLISYHSKYEEEIIDKYKKYNLKYKFYDKYYVDRTQLINSWKLEDVDKLYDSILAIRPDIYFKDFFLDIFDPFVTKICYPSVCFIGMHRSGNSPRINDTIVFIPNKYFELVYYTIGIKTYHDSVKDYIEHSNKIDKPLTLSNDFDFFLKTMHDSDSAKDYNPIYYLISRPECKRWHSYGYEIRDIDFLPIETNNILYNFPDWNLLEHNISRKQYNQIKNLDNLWEWWDISHGYKKFIDIIELDLSANIENLTSVTPSRCDYESYWSYKNNYKLYFYNQYKKITSILYKKNDLEFTGQSMVVDHSFCLKKITNTLITNNFNIISNNKKLRVALCLRGAVSRKSQASPSQGEIYNLNNDDYIDFKAVYRSINKHILQSNSSMDIDTFIHCWNEDLSSELNVLYNPAAFIYENNDMYKDEILMRCQDERQFSAVSQALSIKRVIQLKESYERLNNFEYDIIILYRPDILLWQDIILTDYNNISDSVYVNGHPDGGGDFHFIMSSYHSKKFKELYDSILIHPIENSQCPHGWIKNFIINNITANLQIDNIIPGLHQEVARPQKLIKYSINKYGIDPSIFMEYGLNKDYIFNTN
jgi:hypothetical protein